MNTIIKTNKLTKIFGVEKALDNLSITIEKGQIYGLVGKNGAGKTTLIRILCGLAYKNSGTYEINGVSDDNKDINQERRKMAAIIEAPALYKHMTAFDNLKMQALVCGLKNYQEKIIEILKLVELDKAGQKKVKNFSLGMKQRLAIAVSLINDPEILVFDEPMNGLDPEGIKQLRELMVALNKEKEITIIISSHILDELAKVADKYAFIDKGRLLEEITNKELHDKITSYVEIQVSSLDNIKNVLETIKGMSHYEINSNNVIKIYGGLEAGIIASVLFQNGYEIGKIQTHNFDIEGYFINLIGGKHD